MRLVAYLRTSTGNGNGDSLGAQEDACREWATAHGHEVVSTFEDRGVSGGEELLPFTSEQAIRARLDARAAAVVAT
jgi:DNA invertase Pin-like site-specific DNA recombinase